MKNRGLRARLSRTLLLQVTFISIAAVLGVVFAKALIEEVLIRQALRDEASYFWEQYGDNRQFPLPDTRNLTAYMNEAPEPLSGLPLGFHNLQRSEVQGLVFVSEEYGKHLILVFDGRRVDDLSFYFGLVPLAVVLLILYLAVWLGFRASRRAVSPIIALAREVGELDIEAPDPAAFDPERLPENPDEEVTALARAMMRFAQRLNEFVDRERNFTRDASHELRSPLTVMRMASDMLAADPSLSESGRRAAQRIRRAGRDMEELITAFLLLARESESGLPVEPLCVNDIVVEELERARVLAEGKPVEADLKQQCRLLLEAPEKVLSILIGNLLRNAFSYTDAGQVRVTVSPGHVVIEDSGVGMPEDKVREMYKPFVRGESSQRGGYGVGLTIVRRLSDRFGWPVSIESKLGAGTRVEISFPQARSEPL